MKANMMYGGRAKLAMEQMYPALEKGSIYPPSARRLLCIGKAKNVCEVCFNDVDNEISNRIIQLREPYCIQACWHCTTSMGMSKCIRKVGPFFQGHRMETNIVLDSSRSCTKRTSWRVVGRRNEAAEVPWSREKNIPLDYIPAILGRRGTLRSRTRDKNNYVWSTPFRDKSGELVGPIVTYNKALSFINLLSTYDSTNEKIEAYERYFSVWFDAPNVDDNSYVKLRDAFDETYERANQMEEERAESKRVRVRNWRKKKIENTGKLLELVREHVENPNNRFLLNWDENNEYVNYGVQGKRFSYVPSVWMNLQWVHDVLRDAIKTPSKYRTKRDIVGLARQLEARVDEESNERRLVIWESDRTHYRHRYLQPRALRQVCDIRNHVGVTRARRLRRVHRRFTMMTRRRYNLRGG